MSDESDAVFNIADPQNKRFLMRLAVDCLRSDRRLAFVQLHVIAAFIDGLAAPPKGHERKVVVAYLEAHFPGVSQAIGADTFYTAVRSKAIHEFALAPPIALAHSDRMQDPNAYVESRTIDGVSWTVLNIDQVVTEFIHHLDELERSSRGQPN